MKPRVLLAAVALSTPVLLMCDAESMVFWLTDHQAEDLPFSTVSAVGDELFLEWNPIDGTATDLLFSTNETLPDLATTNRFDNLTPPATVIVDLDQTYTLRLLARDVDDPTQIRAVTAAQNVPTLTTLLAPLIDPAPGDACDQVTPDFPISGLRADARYEWEIDVADGRLLSGSTAASPLRITEPLPNGSHTVRLRQSLGPSVSIWTTRIHAVASTPAPTLAPLPITSGCLSDTVMVSWTGSSTDYRVEAAVDGDFANPAVAQVEAGPSVDLTLDTAGAWQVRVRGESPCPTAWSDLSEVLTVSAPATVSPQTSPENSFCADALGFTWTTTASEVELQVAVDGTNFATPLLTQTFTTQSELLLTTTPGWAVAGTYGWRLRATQPCPGDWQTGAAFTVGDLYRETSLWTNATGALGTAIDVAANVAYVSLSDHTIREVDLTDGSMTVLAGLSGSPGLSNVAPGQFSTPTDLALGTDGWLYVADTGNHVIRRVETTAGTVETYAGSGVPGLMGTLPTPRATAQFFGPSNLAWVSLGGTEVLLASSPSGNRVVTLIDATDARRISGGFLQGYTDGSTAGLEAEALSPIIAGQLADERMIFLDRDNHALRVIEDTGTAFETTTLVGAAPPIAQAGGTDGPFATARLQSPFALTMIDGNTAWVLDGSPARVRVVDFTLGTVTTLTQAPPAGSGDVISRGGCGVFFGGASTPAEILLWD